MVIVDIDEESLQQIGQWPWPRTVFADLIDKLGEMGAVVVAFDVIFAEPDRTSPRLVGASLAEIGPELRQTLADLPDHDVVMANAMRENRVVLGQPASARELGHITETPLPTAAIAELNGDPRPYLVAFADTVRSVPVLETAAKGIGLVTIPPEIDGVVRRVPALAAVGDLVMPALSIETLRVATGQSTVAVRSGNSGVREIVLQGVAIPTDQRGRMWVYYSESNTELYVSATDILNGTADPARFANRIVLVGSSAAGLNDIKATPISGNMAGVEIHAQLLEGILTSDFLRRPTWAIGAERGFMIVVGLLVAVLGTRLSAGWMPPLVVLTSGTFLAASWLSFSWYNLLIDGVYPAMAVSSLVLWLTVAKYIREEQQRRAMRLMFNQYLAPAMIDRLVADPEQLVLAGESRELTIMFADIRGFTTLSEKFSDSPQRLTQLINRYFTGMTAEVLRRDGTIDKYIGDAMMAFWNAPVDCPDHPRQACLASIAVLESVRRINDEIAVELTADEVPFGALTIGIGLNTGECQVGNLGSEQRFNYSAMGDPVNVASRIEDQTKLYGVGILIGENTRAGVSDLAMLPADLILLKGKVAPTWIHALLGDDAFAARPDFIELSDLHQKMLDAYQARRWDIAENYMLQCRKIGAAFGLHRLYKLYQDRISEMRKADPGSDWNGVTIADKHVGFVSH